MIKTQIAFTAPHFATSQVGMEILERGGTAIEAMVAAAASIAVEYPHMNGLGGDGFWLISEPGRAPVAIDACGTAASDLSMYEGLSSIPSRGAKAALTMAGAVSGWQKALEISAEWQPNLSLDVLFDRAINQAGWGIEVTKSLSDASFKTFDDLAEFDGFSQFLIKEKGKILKLKAISQTLNKLAKNGLDDFYRGEIAKDLAKDLQATGSPLRLTDFEHYHAKMVEPLSLKISNATLYNLPAPTQGLASLLILGIFDRIKDKVSSHAELVHYLIECTKQAFIVRNQNITDPSRVDVDFEDCLSDESIQKMADAISDNQVMPWPHVAKPGDTVWMGACDSEGRMVSYIQSLYWEFGSGIVSPSTGIVWNNRGTSFSLEKDSLQALQPGLKPFHTLNPAYAEFTDGRRMSYGTMGGEGQPQTQAAIFARHVFQDLPLADSISLGRWLLGRTWGDQSHNVKVEKDLFDEIGDALIAKGHDVQVVEACNEMMGHAGAIVLNIDGSANAASDPRSDGKAYTQFLSSEQDA